MTILDMQEARDTALVEAMSRGDETAAAELYDRHSAMLFALAVRIVRETVDAEGIVLEAFMQAWRTAGTFDASRATVAGWLVAITRTRAIDFMRSRVRRERLVETVAREQEVSVTPEAVIADESLEVRERNSVIRNALRQLPDAQRMAIELAFYGGLTHAEIAERLREPLGTVKTRIRLGMSKLRDALQTVTGGAPA